MSEPAVAVEDRIAWAMGRMTGADLDSARSALEDALDRAAGTSLEPRVALLLGCLLVELGLPDPADRVLDRAVRGADPLVTVASGTILVGLRLEREDWARARVAAGALSAAATTRGNALGVAAAEIAIAACLEHTEGRDAALGWLAEADARLWSWGHVAARNLVVARILEMRPDEGRG